jgi:imidazoleglycerol phosphate synthase glutamine amidotransferase subunit HisH
MYFVHSYEFIPEDKSVISSTTDYSSNIVCSIEKENCFWNSVSSLKKVIKLDLK